MPHSRILVLGGSGFIGTHVVSRLSAQGLRVLVTRPRGSRAALVVRDGPVTVSVVRDEERLALPLVVGSHRIELLEGGRVVDVREVEVLGPSAATFPP